MEVRRAGYSDLPAIVEIYNQAVLTTTATYDELSRTLEEQTLWYEEHQQAGHPIFVAENERDGVVGWSALGRFRSRSAYRFTLEDAVYVAAEHRGRGVGKLLIPPLIEGATALGAHAVIAAIDSNGEASLRLHAAFGFEPVGRLKQVGYKFERWLDVVYMERLLP